MLQLRPREYFTIARGLEDHTDSGTYYVQAVIRNAKTDALIDTVNLTDHGSRRFSTPWQVPADTSGEGFYILITTTIYDDSGYTSKSGSYGEKFDTYLVQDRPNPNLGMGGGGVDIDYKKVRAMLKEEIAGIPPAPDIPDFPSVDLRPVFDRLEGISEAIGAIPQPATINMKPVMDALEAVRSAVANFHIPECDHTPFTKALDTFESSATELNRVVANLGKAFIEDQDALKSSIEANLSDVLRRSDLKKLIDPPAPAPSEKGPRKMPQP